MAEILKGVANVRSFGECCTWTKLQQVLQVGEVSEGVVVLHRDAVPGGSADLCDAEGQVDCSMGGAMLAGDVCVAIRVLCSAWEVVRVEQSILDHGFHSLSLRTLAVVRWFGGEGLFFAECGRDAEGDEHAGLCGEVDPAGDVGSVAPLPVGGDDERGGFGLGHRVFGLAECEAVRLLGAAVGGW